MIRSMEQQHLSKEKSRWRMELQVFWWEELNFAHGASRPAAPPHATPLIAPTFFVLCQEAAPMPADNMGSLTWHPQDSQNALHCIIFMKTFYDWMRWKVGEVISSAPPPIREGLEFIK